MPVQGVEPLDFTSLVLTFEKPDTIRFPFLTLAKACIDSGDGAAIAFNAANEIAVHAFLDGACAFPNIFSTVEKTFNLDIWPHKISSLEDVLAYDQLAREKARELLRLQL